MKAFAVILATLLLAAGCGEGDGAPARPDGEPTYSGAVIETGDGVVLVRSDGDACGIWVKGADSVRVLRMSAGGTYSPASWDDLEPAQNVDLWIPGPIAESCPMQGTAEAVVIVDAAPA
jgi:Protein of unknown function (DUF3221)